MKVNQTSLTVTALQLLVVSELVAETELELMHIVPLAGMMTGCAVAQLSLAGWANVVDAPNTPNTISPKINSRAVAKHMLS